MLEQTHKKGEIIRKNYISSQRHTLEVSLMPIRRRAGFLVATSVTASVYTLQQLHFIATTPVQKNEQRKD